MRKWNIPLTYQPKIEPVRNRTCGQTIRPGRKFNVGDLVRFYIWSGKPYRSKRETITEYAPITGVYDITVFPLGLLFRNHSFDSYFYPGTSPLFRENRDLAWNTWGVNRIAELDGIVPPTGEALRDVLIQKNGKIPDKGIDMQIIRW